jgi:lincosamide nucleotidyltransferase A/C/D/E
VGDSIMTALDAAELVLGLRNAGVRCWVMGGWGIDALLRRETRPHHDLDLLVRVEDLPAANAWLRGEGFERRYAWEENQPVRIAKQVYDTAFVDGHEDGREVDVHAVEVDVHTQVRLATTDPWDLPADTLTGVGVINGRRVNCVTRAAQVMMHRGYDLPQKHRDDLSLLDGS